MENYPYNDLTINAFSLTLKQHSLKVKLVIDLQVSPDVLQARVGERWTHIASGRTYNYTFNPPLKIGYDDVTGEPLAQRLSD